jgi:hypothetical protein
MTASQDDQPAAADLHRLDLAAVHQSVNGGIRKAGDLDKSLNCDRYQILLCGDHARERHGSKAIFTTNALRMTTT